MNPPMVGALGTVVTPKGLQVVGMLILKPMLVLHVHQIKEYKIANHEKMKVLRMNNIEKFLHSRFSLSIIFPMCVQAGILQLICAVYDLFYFSFICHQTH